MARSAAHSEATDRVIRWWSPARTVMHVADLSADVIELLRTDVDRLVFSAAPLQLKDRCIAARYDRPEGPMLVKRHTWGTLSRTLRSVWRSSVARGCWRIARKLETRGIPTPRPLACVETRFGLIGYRSYLMTEYIEGKSLYDYVRDETSPLPVLEDLARQVASIWSQLVAGNISHNDMKPENFIVDLSGRVWLIDLERVRSHAVKRRMKRRQLSDVRTFLHPRAWRNLAEARGIFSDAFLKTSHADWVRDAIVCDDLAPVRAVHPARDDSPRLSVLVLCQDSTADRAGIVRAIESTKHFADEIVVFAARADNSSDDALDAATDVAIAGSIGAPLARLSGLAPRLARHPWVLVLEAGEAVSPLLAIDVEEQIAAGCEWDAFRIPIEQQAFGQCVESPLRREASPVRLLNQQCCSYSVAGGALAVSADPERTSELGGAIERDVCSSVAEFIAVLNDESSRVAELRFQQGKSAALGRAAFETIRQFIRRYFGESRFQHGWAGFQLSVLESLGAWLPAAKLWQLNHQFQSVDGAAAEIGGDVDVATAPGPGRVSAVIGATRAKAA